MKTKITTLMIALLAILLSHKTKAQCDIYNQLGCTAQVEVLFYSSCGPNISCWSTTMSISPNTVIPLNCNLCGVSLCDISVRVMSLGGISISPIITAYFGTACPGPSTSVPGGLPCGTGSAANVCYTGSKFLIH